MTTSVPDTVEAKNKNVPNLFCLFMMITFVILPTYQSGTIFPAIYDLNLNLLTLNPVQGVDNIQGTEFYSSINGKYAILIVMDDKNMYVYTYNPRGEPVPAMKIDR